VTPALPAPAALIGGTLVGLAVSTLFIIVLLAGFSVLLGFPKLRRSGGRTLIVRNLDEAIGGFRPFLKADTPRGPIDQLDTDELRETRKRPASA
jgi:hypothetical protein